MEQRLVPDDFVIPDEVKTDRFLLRMIRVSDVEKDYDAVMSSLEHLRNVFKPDDTWPADDLTLEQDKEDLKWHQSEFRKRTSFTYMVMSLDENQCLGGVHIYPSEKEQYETKVFIWVRASERSTDLDEVLFTAVQKWLSDIWPFKQVAFPGRQIPWEEWAKLE
ncbi:GNAT family N-acetyltransferase [candidate division CSSED10-310 bacterium]|uniref:GNAT family N-acetyltransferase n=1 Tax=candidate division CSSED10-310 bacterium TaxID=2855610 RepID=A0ABV6YWN4_UNCC1